MLQMLQLCPDSLDPQWCEGFSLDRVGTISRTVESGSSRVTLIIKVKQTSNCHKQVRKHITGSK